MQKKDNQNRLRANGNLEKNITWAKEREEERRERVKSRAGAMGCLPNHLPRGNGGTY